MRARGSGPWRFPDVICKAQFTEEGYLNRKGWGNSGVLGALERTAQARARSVAIRHHGSSHDDPFLDGIENFCQQMITERDCGFRCLLAREGMTVEL